MAPGPEHVAIEQDLNRQVVAITKILRQGTADEITREIPK